MPTSQPDRPPTAGPDGATYECYRVVPTGDGDVIVFDIEREMAWIQASNAVSLENWR